MATRTKRERAHTTDRESSGEAEVIFVERQFPIVLRYPLLWGMIFILIGMVPWSIATAHALSWQSSSVVWMLFVFLALLIYWGYYFVRWFFTVLILTEDDITWVRQQGLFKRSVESLTLNNVQSVNYTIPGMQGALFRFGSLQIDTLSGSGRMKIKYMYKPAELQEIIMSQLPAYGSTSDDEIVYDPEDKTDQE